MSKKVTKITGWTLAILLGLSFTLTSFTKLSKDESANATQSELKSESSTFKMNEKENAKQIVVDYFKHLYDGNTNAIVDLYSENAVLMPADLPTATGKSQLIVAYNQTFGAVKFVSSTINYDEISIYGDIAVIRTTSNVKLFLIKEKLDIQNKMREFFILKKEKGKWKISTYMFNKEL